MRDNHRTGDKGRLKTLLEDFEGIFLKQCILILLQSKQAAEKEKPGVQSAECRLQTRAAIGAGEELISILSDSTPPPLTSSRRKISLTHCPTIDSLHLQNDNLDIYPHLEIPTLTP